jgi:hypothetical protein
MPPFAAARPTRWLVVVALTLVFASSRKQGGPAGAVLSPGHTYRKGLGVGTERGIRDVAKDGKVNIAWTESSDAVKIEPDESKTTFYLKLAKNDVDPGETQLLGEPSVVSSPPGVCRPALEGAVATLRKIQSGVALDLRLVYNCLKAGEATMLVTVPVPGHNALKFAFEKRCVDQVYAMLQMGTVGDTADAVDNVIRLGVPRRSWAATTAAIVEGTYRARRTFAVSVSKVAHADPNVEAHAKQRMSRPSIEVDPPILGAHIEGSFNLTGTKTITLSRNMSDTLRQLHVVMHCKERGKAKITMTLLPFPLFQPFQPIKIAWTHVCGAAPRRGFMMTSMSVRERAHGGNVTRAKTVMAEDADVVMDGDDSSDWVTRKFTMDQQAANMHFFFGLRPVPGLEDQGVVQNIGVPTIVVDPPGVLKAELIVNGCNVKNIGNSTRCTGGAGGSAGGQVVINQGAWMPMTVEMRCTVEGEVLSGDQVLGNGCTVTQGNNCTAAVPLVHQNSNVTMAKRRAIMLSDLTESQGEATAKVTITLPLHVYNPVVVTFRKQCGGHKSGFEVETSKDNVELPAKEVRRRRRRGGGVGGRGLCTLEAWSLGCGMCRCFNACVCVCVCACPCFLGVFLCALVGTGAWWLVVCLCVS